MKYRYTIGTTADNDIIYANPFVSKQHARIDIEPDGKMFLEDYSTNGTYVRGIIVQQDRVLLFRGDEVKFAEGAELDWNRIDTMGKNKNATVSKWLFPASIVVALIPLFILAFSIIRGDKNEDHINDLAQSIPDDLSYPNQKDDDDAIYHQQEEPKDDLRQQRKRRNPQRDTGSNKDKSEPENSDDTEKTEEQIEKEALEEEYVQKIGKAIEDIGITIPKLENELLEDIGREELIKYEIDKLKNLKKELLEKFYNKEAKLLKNFSDENRKRIDKILADIREITTSFRNFK